MIDSSTLQDLADRTALDRPRTEHMVWAISDSNDNDLLEELLLRMSPTDTGVGRRPCCYEQLIGDHLRSPRTQSDS